MQTKSCTACGQAFACGRHAATCWCQALPPLPAQALLTGADCLCPQCLRQRVESAAASQPPDGSLRD